MNSGRSRCKPLLLHLLLHFLLGAHLSFISLAIATYSNSNQTTKPPSCRPDQASALLQLKRSFSTEESQCTLASWRHGTDCCRWEGIRCGDADGRVTALDLGECGLVSGGGLHPALFDLTSLRRLDLADNDFNESRLPSAGFERLAELVYLNLSATGFVGDIPRGIRQLGKLVSLDLSTWIYLLDLDDYFVPLGDGRWPLVEPDVGSLVANLSNLKELRLDSVDLSSNGAAWCDGFANSTPQLQVLRLPNTGLDAPICGSLSSIRSLVEINLLCNRLYGQVPESFADLPNLSVLILAYNRLEGWFPTSIFRNNNLTVVDIRYNFDISGSLPNHFSSDSALTKLLCSNTNFSGPVPSSINNLTSLKYLGIASSDFHQELPTSIGELNSLRSLEVSGANIVGKIPSWVTNLTSLVFLQFSNCGLSGQVPSSIGNLKNLTSLQLYGCNFSGQIPPHIFNLTQLQDIKFRSNSFIGTIELSSFFKLPNLSRLSLSNNKLTVVEGEYNSSLLESTENFETLGLASCNISKLPDTLRHMYSILVLDLSNNHLHGVVPQWAWETWVDSLILLNLSHNQFSSIGYDFVRPANINLLDISFNLFQGPIPIPGPNNELFDCSNNHFSSMPFNFGSHLSIASFLMASRNNLSGEIPPSICEGTMLQLLDLSYNNFGGSIPSCLIGNMSHLNVLNLKGNRLTGRLPDSLKQECAFDALDFSDNQIEGQLPRSLVVCKDLEVVDIGNNRISDTFPCWMSVLPKLQVLVLKSNKFDGMVGPSDSGDKNSCEFKKLRIFDLASNNFSGLLVHEWFKSMKSMTTQTVNETLVMGNQYKLLDHTYQFTASITYKGLDIIFSKILRTIVVIDISNNALQGAIPESIGDLLLLSGVNMSHNALTGMIPSQLGALHQLESLDVSSNDLSGEIPQELASLDFLSVLNLSYNKLEGRIPDSPHFLTFANLSFLGNIGLCGLQVSKACNNITPNVDDVDLPHSDEMKSKDIVLLFLFSGLGFGVGFAVAVVLAFGFRLRGICQGNIFLC